MSQPESPRRIASRDSLRYLHPIPRQELIMKSKTTSYGERPQPLVKQVFDELHRQILTFELKPFQMLSEASVSEMLGVSRTPAREALAMLAAKNFVDVLPQRGSQIAPLRAADLERSQFMREALEVALLRRAMDRGRNQELAQALQREVALQKTFAAIDDKDRFYASDEAFHGHIAEAAGFAEILPEILRVKDHMDRFRHLMVSSVDDIRIVIRQHAEIAEAVAQGDASRAETLLGEHLRRIISYVGETRDRFPEYFEETAETRRVVR